MSQSLNPTYKPATIADFTPEWIASVRSALKRDGQAARAGIWNFDSPHAVIEVQSINTGEWQPLNLPTNATHFVTEGARDTILELLVGKEHKRMSA